jgi:hypothetical protein
MPARRFPPLMPLAYASLRSRERAYPACRCVSVLAPVWGSSSPVCRRLAAGPDLLSCHQRGLAAYSTLVSISFLQIVKQCTVRSNQHEFEEIAKCAVLADLAAFNIMRHPHPYRHPVRK